MMRCLGTGLCEKLLFIAFWLALGLPTWLTFRELCLCCLKKLYHSSPLLGSSSVAAIAIAGKSLAVVDFLGFILYTSGPTGERDDVIKFYLVGLSASLAEFRNLG